MTRGHLLDAGLSEHDIKGRVARGSLRTVHAGVYATFGRTLDYETGVLAACFAAGEGAVASHRSALAMWGLLDGPQPIEITAPRNRHPLPDRVVVHRPNVLRPVDVTERRGVPITKPLRSLLDAGAGALRQHLDRRALGDRRPESMIEPLMARLLYDDLGIGPVEYQPTVLIAGRRFRPDFRIPAAMTIVEVDGLDAHASRQALDSDLERQNLFVRSGYLALRYTVIHLRRPAKVAAEVKSVCRERIEQVGRLTA